MSVWTRALIVSPGCIVALASLADGVRTYLVPPEKNAIYALGHWWDRTWELDAPAFLLGLGMIITGLVVGRRRASATYSREGHRE